MPRLAIAIAIAVLLASCGDASTGATEQPAVCGESPPVAAGTVTDDRLDEISGLVIGRRSPGVIWVHNDSGDGPVLYALDEAGEVRASYVLEGADARDWEDIAIGPGPEPGRFYLYLGDIGDNEGTRSRITIYRVEEPTLVRDDADQTLGDVAIIHLAYPDGARDAETLLVDPATGTLIVVSKSFSGQSAMYRAEPVPGPGVTQMERFATLQLGLGQPATGGDISADRERIAIRTYSSIRVWPISDGQSIEAAMATEACRVIVGNEQQGEAVGFDAGRALATISEGAGSTVYRYDDPYVSGD